MTICGLEVPGSSEEHRFRAVQIGVRPWQGQHNGYGIFMIPERYKHNRLYATTLKIQGFTMRFSAVSAEDEDRDNIVVELGIT